MTKSQRVRCFVHKKSPNTPQILFFLISLLCSRSKMRRNEIEWSTSNLDLYKLQLVILLPPLKTESGNKKNATIELNLNCKYWGWLKRTQYPQLRNCGKHIYHLSFMTISNKEKMYFTPIFRILSYMWNFRTTLTINYEV